ncbi:MAG: Sulfate/thiosulfate import ATP-binding protein CysA [Firmicutes bacterium ADurb.Bin300]|nr:MAG: Sulfate/thiosulfate import ATP-binding protein CysA [Firmicutes bacterium ADurb.Bin300]HOD02624.1 ATP-binding cassette domain-containing protein [Clostridiales bacterium]
MIAIKNLKKKYSADFTLKIDSLEIPAGEKIALVGANGSGKSTLLKLVSGYIEPDEGEIIFERSIDAAYLPQNPYIFSGSVRKNILVGLVKKEDKSDSEARLKLLLDNVGLSRFDKKSAGKLSGGEMQRMVFARMLIGSHKLLLLDEPLSAVDVDFKDTLEEILSDYCRRNGTTLIMSTHTPIEAVKICDKLIIMHKGEVAEYGDCGEIIKNPKTNFGKAFLRQWRITDA